MSGSMCHTDKWLEIISFSVSHVDRAVFIYVCPVFFDTSGHVVCLSACPKPDNAGNDDSIAPHCIIFLYTILLNSVF